MLGCVYLHQPGWMRMSVCVCCAVWEECTRHGQWEYWQRTVCNPCKIHVLCCFYKRALEWFPGEHYAGAMGGWSRGQRNMWETEQRKRAGERERDIKEERWTCLRGAKKKKWRLSLCTVKGLSEAKARPPKPVFSSVIAQREIDTPYRLKVSTFQMEPKHEAINFSLSYFLTFPCPENLLKPTCGDSASLKEAWEGGRERESSDSESGYMGDTGPVIKPPPPLTYCVLRVFLHSMSLCASTYLSLSLLLANSG